MRFGSKAKAKDKGKKRESSSSESEDKDAKKTLGRYGGRNIFCTGHIPLTVM